MSSGRDAAQQRWAAASGLFKCLSAPLRIGIIELLLDSPRTVSQIVEALDAPQPLISQHLRVLRDHCLVEGDRVGRETTYSLVDDHVSHIVRDAIVHTTEHDPSTPKDHHQPADQHLRKDTP